MKKIIKTMALSCLLLTLLGIVSTLQAGSGTDYTIVSSDDAQSLVYTWEDISTTGTLSSLSTRDDAEEAVNLNFTFNFYDVDYTTVYASTNGIIYFNAGDGRFANTYPKANLGPIIGGLDCDLDPGSGGNIYYSSSSERLIIQYEEVADYEDNSFLHTFQIVLYSSGEIYLYYKSSLGFVSGSNQYAIAVQNDAGTIWTVATQNAENYIHDELAVRIATSTQANSLATSASPVYGREISHKGLENLNNNCLVKGDGFGIGWVSLIFVMTLLVIRRSRVKI